MTKTTAACLKTGPVPIEKELLPLSVPVHTTFSGITQQCVGESVECSELCLVTLSADVDYHPLTA